METTAYYAFGLPLYASLVAVEAWRARRCGRQTLSFAESVGNLSAGLGSIAVGLFLGPALYLLYETAFAHMALVHWSSGSAGSWLLAVVVADFGHYWHHRLDHRVALCWSVHGVHHQPEEMNFTVAMRHAWFSDLYSFPFYAAAPLLGVPAWQFFIATTLLSLHALLTHSVEYRFPSLGIFVTPQSHILHHARNPRYIDRNFGAMLCVWDRLFGTAIEVDSTEPIDYGTLRGYETHDGVRSQWVLLRDLLAMAQQTPRLADKLRVFLSRPGWIPPGAMLPPLHPPPASAQIPRTTKVGVAALFVVTSAFALWVFILRDLHPPMVLVASFAAILGSLVLCGTLLDRRPM